MLKKSNKNLKKFGHMEKFAQCGSNRLMEPSHETMALFILRKVMLSNTHAQPSSGARCLIFGLTLRLLPYFMCENSEGSGETVQMRRLA